MAATAETERYEFGRRSIPTMPRRCATPFMRRVHEVGASLPSEAELLTGSPR